LFVSSSIGYRLLAAPLYLVADGIINSLAFIPTSIWVQIGCGASSVQAKMESGDPSVSIYLLVNSLLALGVARRDIAIAIAGDL
jgi:hypothetical protein